MEKTYYNKRTWLNKEDSPSIGSVVAFDGETLWRGEIYRNIFLSVSDCAVSARLHKTENDTVEDFINKLKLLRNEIECFTKHLENSMDEKNGHGDDERS